MHSGRSSAGARYLPRPASDEECYGWQVSLDQYPSHQSWTWHAYGPRGSERGRAASESAAVTEAKAAAIRLSKPGRVLAFENPRTP